MFKTKDTKKTYTCPYFEVNEDLVEVAEGEEITYWRLEAKDSVQVVPIFVDGDSVDFIMVQQHRHPVSRKTLEFPGGAIDKGEIPKIAALRELQEETGYTTPSLKFLYQFNPSVAKSSARTFVYLALLEGDPGANNLDKVEKYSELEVVRLSSDDLLKKMLDNEITCSATLAALSVVLLRSPKAIEYANSLQEESNNEEIQPELQQ